MPTMNTESLFLFLIILFGLAICSFLGTTCNKETMTNMNNSHNNNNPINNNFNNNNPSNNNFNNNNSRYDNYNHYTGSSASLQNGNTFYGGNGGKVVVNTNKNGVQTLSVTLGSGQQSITLTQDNVSSTEGYTTQQGNNISAAKFYGPNGVTAVVASDNGHQSIKVSTSQGTTVFTENGAAHKNDNTGQLTSSEYYGSTGYTIPNDSNSYNGPYGGIAGSVTGPAGNTAYYAQGPAGNTVAGVNNNYNPYGASAGSVTGPAGNTAYYAQGPGGNTVAGINNNYNPGASAGSVTGPAGNTAYYAQGPAGNTVAGVNNNYNPYGASAGSVTGPAGNTAYYAQGPAGNTVAGVTNDYGAPGVGVMPGAGIGAPGVGVMPGAGLGVPAWQIPSGQEDLYILKSQVVPPVCPACPAGGSCPRKEPCSACPACARCPEPSFECKKVPNYNAINEEYLPQPFLNDFSSFGS